MLTIFSTPKPFRGLEEIIQYNAIKSWTLLHPEIEIILFGDEYGTEEICKKFGIRHEERVERSKSGLKYIDYIFKRAQEIAKYNLLCYVNCDIILMSDFIKAISQLQIVKKPFLMIGRRWNINLGKRMDFHFKWEEKLRSEVISRGQKGGAKGIDYFVFPTGLWKTILPFVLGRFHWDNWLLYKARSSGAILIDASEVVMAVHQNHRYSHPQGRNGVRSDEEANYNHKLLGRFINLYTLDDSTHKLTSQGIIPYFPGIFHFRRFEPRWLWYALLDSTRSFRRYLGLYRIKNFLIK